MFGGGNGNSGDDLYDKALAVVARDRKVSTSYIQRRLEIGYNRAARLIERMEEEGVISRPNHKGAARSAVARSRRVGSQGTNKPLPPRRRDCPLD